MNHLENNMEYPKKRLARRLSNSGTPKKTSETFKDRSGLIILEYSPKSILVTGDTINHSNELHALGGKYNPNLRGGQKGWFFCKARQPSVEKYIETGEVVPHVWSKEDISRFNSQKRDQQARKNTIMGAILNTFESDKTYKGEFIQEKMEELLRQFKV